MQLGGIRYIGYKSREDRFRIWHISDCHLLNAGCAEKELDADIAKIKADPFSFWFGGGDYADYIGYRDGRRFDPDSVDERLSVRDLGQLGAKTTAIVRDKFQPIANKCLGLLLGNHEKEYQRHSEQEHLHSWLCTELGVLNLGYCAIADIVFRRMTGDPMDGEPGIISDEVIVSSSRDSRRFRFFLHHGSGFAQTAGGKLNRLTQFMQAFEADVYFCGHVHDRVGRRLVTLGADANCAKLVHQEKLGMIAGSYLRTYTLNTCTYGEQRGYAPTSLGAAWVEIRPNTKEMRAEI
jgi:hypothetical protein